MSIKAMTNPFGRYLVIFPVLILLTAVGKSTPTPEVQP
jgi:hypothetical protein